MRSSLALNRQDSVIPLGIQRLNGSTLRKQLSVLSFLQSEPMCGIHVGLGLSQTEEMHDLILYYQAI